VSDLLKYMKLVMVERLLRNSSSGALTSAACPPALSWKALATAAGSGARLLDVAIACCMPASPATASTTSGPRATCCSLWSMYSLLIAERYGCMLDALMVPSVPRYAMYRTMCMTLHLRGSKCDVLQNLRKCCSALLYVSYVLGSLLDVRRDRASSPSES